MLKTLNKWIKTSTPWQTLSRFFLVWLMTSTLIISSVTIFGIAPPTPAQVQTACVPNVFYGSQFGGTALYAIDIGTGEARAVGNLSRQTAAISRDADTGRIYYIQNNTGGGKSPVFYFDPATGDNQPVGTTTATLLPGQDVFIKMAQRNNGTIYAAASGNAIFKIDKSNGSTTQVNVTPTLPVGSGDIAFDPNSFDPNSSATLFVTIRDPATDQLSLYSVNVDTGVATLITKGTPPVVPASGSIAFGPDGNLYVDEFNGVTTRLRRISTSDGSVGAPRDIGFDIAPFTGAGPLNTAGFPGITDFGTLPTRSPKITLDVQKTGSNTAAIAGGSFSYTIRLSNQGDCDVKGLKLQDTLPAAFTGATWTSRFVQASDETLSGVGQITPASGTGDVDATVNLSVGSRLIVTINGIIDPATANNTTITNTAVVISDRFIRSSVTTPVINILGGTPDIGITKDVAPTYTTGGNVVYTLKVNNKGTAIPGGSVTVADPGPPGTTFVSSSSNVGTCTKFPCIFPANLFPRAPAAGVVITATYSTSTGTPLQLNNVATASFPGEDPRLLGNNQAIAKTVAPAPPVVIPPIIPPVVDVAIGISAPPSVPPGANFTVTLTARNVGTASADNVVVGYDVPAGVTVVSVPTGCIYNPTASTIVCAAIPTFGRGAATNYDFVFKAPDTPTVLTGVARISTTSPEPNTGNNTAAATTTVALGAPNPTLPADLVIPGGTTPGTTPPAPLVLGAALQANSPVNNRDGTETVTLTVTINNTGTQPLRNLQAVIDLIKTFTGTQDFVVVSVNSTSFPVNPNFNGRDIQNLLASSAAIAPNSSGTITFGVRVTPGFNLGPYFASVTVRGTDPSGVVITDISTLGNVPDANGNGTPSDDSTPTPIQFTGLPNLRIVKRMTAAVRNGAPLRTNLNFNTFLDDPNDNNDNAPGWSALSPIGLARITEANLLQSGDDLEYTVYFLSDGTGVASNAQFCDPVPAGSTFLADTYGAGSGTLLRLEGTERPQTNATDGDPGRFIPALTPAPSPCPSLNNPNGSVFIQIPTLSNRSPNNVGFFRFRVKID